MRKILAFVVIAFFFIAPSPSDAGCCDKLKLKLMLKPPLKKKLEQACPCLASLKLPCKKK